MDKGMFSVNICCRLLINVTFFRFNGMSFWKTIACISIRLQSCCLVACLPDSRRQAGSRSSGLFYIRRGFNHTPVKQLQTCQIGHYSNLVLFLTVAAKKSL